MAENQEHEEVVDISNFAASLTEMERLKWFVALQVLFFIGSPFAGGFHNTVWSMLDSALLVVSFGFTGLVIILPSRKHRVQAFYVAVLFYVLGVFDIAFNILWTGFVGWKV